MNNFKIFIFNVGQGDNILIELPSGDFGVIDFFYDNNINNQIEPPALTYLRKIKNVKIAFVHITHYHNDHLKGINKFFKWVKKNNITVKEWWLPGIIDKRKKIASLIDSNFNSESLVDSIDKNQVTPDYSIENLDSYINSIEYLEDFIEFVDKGAHNIQYIFGDPSQKYISKHHKFEILSLAPVNKFAVKYMAKEVIDIIKYAICKRHIKNDLNYMSTVLCLHLIDKKLKFTFCGDAPKDSIEASIELYNSEFKSLKDHHGNLQAIFVKAAHHGSSESSSDIIWNNFLGESTNNKTIVAISAGEHGGYHHPHKETIKQIRDSCQNRSFDVSVFSTNNNSFCDSIPIDNSNSEIIEKDKNKIENLLNDDFSNNDNLLYAKSEFIAYLYQFENGSFNVSPMDSF